MLKALRNAISKTVICACFILGFSSHSHAQKRGEAFVDSLLQELPKAKEDTSKIKILNQLSERSCQSANFGFALQYADSAMVLAKRADFKKGTAAAFNNIGNVN